MLRTLQFLLGLLGMLIAATDIIAAPPNYRVELLDTGQFDAPSAHLPAGGFLMAGAFISPNGRYVVVGVGDNNDPDPVVRFLARLDLDAGTAELIPDIEQPFPFGINDEGDFVARGLGPNGDVSGQVHYWSPSMGAISFGEASLPARFLSHGDGVGFPRVLNNFGQVLVRNEAGESILWDPVADTRTVIGLDAGEPGFVNAVSLNNLGQVVGSITFPTNATNEVDVRPFIWDVSNGLRVLIDLELISPDTGPFTDFGRLAIANAINDAGMIAGETWDETSALLGLHWNSEAAVPTLLPCQSSGMSQPPQRCAVWLQNDAGDLVGGEEAGGEIESHVIWDGDEPFLLRDRIVVGPQDECGIFSIANNGTLAGNCGGPALVIPIPSGPQLDVTTPLPGDELIAGIVQVEGLATDDVEVISVTVNGTEADLEAAGNPDDPNEVAFSVPLLLAPGMQTIEVVAADSDGNTETVSLEVLVLDPDAQAPEVSDVVADPNPAPVDEAIQLSAEIDDTGTGGSPIAGVQYSIDGGPAAAMSAEDGALDEPAESVVAHIPGISEPGVYEVCVTAADVAGNVSAPSCTFVAVFDPSDGFVTGGGWIDAPAGTYRPDPQWSGRANFGFVARYRNGASVPSGSTEFQFHSGGLNFHSIAYDWLVVSQGNTTAHFKGSGTVNGQSAPSGLPYGFMLWAHDGSPDTFRIRIWWESADGEVTVFDNGNETALGGGSIVIHKAGG